MKSNKYLDLAKANKRLKTETELAQLLSISKQNLYKIRQGGRITGDLFLKVSAAAEVDIFKLMGEIFEEKADSRENQKKWSDELKKAGKKDEYKQYNDHEDQSVFRF